MAIPPLLSDPAVSVPVVGRDHRGRSQIWKRPVTRRRALHAAGGLALAGIACRHCGVALAQERTGPKPIAGGGFTVDGEVLHVYDYIAGNEPSTIGDFRGLVAVCHLQGEGTVTKGGGGGGVSTPSATGDRLVYDADMRIMKGLYVGEDGREHEGTFGFV